MRYQQISRFLAGAAIEPLESRCLLSADAVRLSDIRPGAADSLSLNDGDFVAAGGKFYFAASDAHGVQPYVSDGTVEGTKPLVPKGLNGGQSADPGDFAVGGSFVYFTAIVGNNGRRQVFRTNISTGKTIQVSNLADPGSANNLEFVNGHAVFFDQNNLTLWRVDGTSSVQFASDINGESYAVVGNKLFFDNPSSRSHPSGLYVTDGSTITFLAAVEPYLEPLGIGFNGDLYFESTGTDNADDELWVSNGTPTGTSPVTDLGSNPFGYGPNDFTVIGSSLYFTAGSSGIRQIFRTDGLSIQQVTHLTSPGAGDLSNVDGTIFFLRQAIGSAVNLYKLVDDQPSLIGTVNQLPSFITVAGKMLYFSSTDSKNNHRLFESDGTGITLVPGDTGINPSGLADVDGNLFYEASDTAHGAELHIVPAAALPPPPPEDLTLEIGNNVDINQGDATPVAFKARIGGGTAKYIYWDLNGKGYVRYDAGKGAKVSMGYAKYAPSVRSVRCLVKTTDGRQVADRLLLTIHNVAPVVTLNVSTDTAAPYQTVKFTARIKDPGLDDTFTVNWDFGDGSPIVTLPVGHVSQVSINHVYKTPNRTEPASVSVTDNFNGNDHDQVNIIVDEVASESHGLVIGYRPGHKVSMADLGGGKFVVFVDGDLVATSELGDRRIVVITGANETLDISPGLRDVATIQTVK